MRMKYNVENSRPSAVGFRLEVEQTKKPCGIFKFVNCCVIIILMLVHYNIVLADNASNSNKKGLEAYDKQKYDESAEYFTEALVERPDTPELKFNRGTALSEMNKTDEAIKELYSAAKNLKDTGQSAAAHFNAGNTMFNADNIEAAVEEFKKAIKLDQSSEDIRYNLELALRKLNQQKKGQEQNQKNEENEDGESQDNQKKDEQEKQQEKDKQEEKDEQQADNSSDREKNEQNEQNQQKPNPQENEVKPMTREEAQRLLDAINDDEKRALSVRYKQMKSSMRQGDDW